MFLKLLAFDHFILFRAPDFRYILKAAQINSNFTITQEHFLIMTYIKSKSKLQH